MASELVNSATSEKLTEIDWVKNIEICELVARDQRLARDVIKAIRKRLGSKNSNAQVYAVMLLEMLMNNNGEHVHKQVIETGLLPKLVKIVKKKSDLLVREKIFLLLDATQTSLGGASGKFPQYYSAYYELVSAGVQFPGRSPPVNPSNQITSKPDKHMSLKGELASFNHEEVIQRADSQIVPESSILQKAGNALEVLREVLDNIDSRHPEGAKDEFTLDLVEQCSFQKQKVMHLVMTSLDEKLVSRAIDLNDQLQKVLAKHDTLLSVRPNSTANLFNHEEVDDEEEAEQLFRRIRKGKACVRPEEEEDMAERPWGVLGASFSRERVNRPLIRPLSLEPRSESNAASPPVAIPPPSAKHESNAVSLPVKIPPPPAKHMERERFFQEKRVDGSSLSNHMRGLSLHSRTASSSNSGSIDFSD